MGAAASMQNAEGISKTDLQNISGVLYDDIIFEELQEEGKVSKEKLLKYASEKGYDERGRIFFENLRQLKVCREGIESLAKICLPSGQIKSIKWKNNIELEDRQKTCDGSRFVDSVESLYDAAKVAWPLYKATLEDILEKCGIPLKVLKYAPMKGKERARQKIEAEYADREAPAASWLFDVCRASVIFEDENSLISFFYALDSELPLLRVKNRFNPPNFNGYRDILVNIKLPLPSGASHICELQLHFDKIKECDFNLKSHQAYEFFRTYFSGNMQAVDERLKLILSLPVDKVSTFSELVDMTLKKGSRHRTQSYLLGLVKLLEHMNELDHALRIRSVLVELYKEKAGGSENHDVAVSLSNQAKALYNQQKYKECAELFKQSLDIRKKTGNPESISKGYNNLAAAYKRLGMFDDAGKLYLDSLALKKENGGEFTASYALGLGNLAELRKSQGRFQRGVELYQRALEIYDKVYSGNRMFKDVGVSVNGYAGAYYGLKNYPKAIELYRQALEIRQRCNRGIFSRGCPRKGEPGACYYGIREK